MGREGKEWGGFYRFSLRARWLAGWVLYSIDIRMFGNGVLDLKDGGMEVLMNKMCC